MPLPSPNSSKRWIVWTIAGLSALALVVLALIVFFSPSILVGILFSLPAPVPSGWHNLPKNRTPDEQALLGIWRPGELGRTIPFADGAPHILAPGDTLTLNPGHTYRFLRRGIYDGNSQLICLRSETGHWSIQAQPNGQPPIGSLLADLPSIQIEHRVIPDLNIDNVDYNRMHGNQSTPAVEPDQNSIAAENNAMNCSSSAPRDYQISTWGIATRRGRFALFRDAPASPYQSVSNPLQTVPAHQVLYEHEESSVPGP